MRADTTKLIIETIGKIPTWIDIKPSKSSSSVDDLYGGGTYIYVREGVVRIQYYVYSFASSHMSDLLSTNIILRIHIYKNGNNTIMCADGSETYNVNVCDVMEYLNITTDVVHKKYTGYHFKDAIDYDMIVKFIVENNLISNGSNEDVIVARRNLICKNILDE